MIAKMSADGTLIVLPENGAEAYALRCWETDTKIGHNDVIRNIKHVYRGDRLHIATEYPVTHRVGDPA